VLTCARVRGLAVTLVVGSGCPANDDDNPASDETGGAPAAEPIDPFDGEGTDPPGEPDPDLTYRAPSSLGNGLVHDSRFDLRAGSHHREVSPAQLAAGVDWASFVSPHAEKVRVGFRPAQVEANVRLEPTNDIPILHIEDRSVYVCDDDASYRTVTKTHLFSDLVAEQARSSSGPAWLGSPRPTAIDSFALGPNSFGFNIVWTYDKSPVKWKLVLGQREAVFNATADNLSQYGYHPISVSGRRRGGASEYSGIFVQDGVARDDWRLMLGRNAMALATEVDAVWDAGYYPDTPLDAPMALASASKSITAAAVVQLMDAQQLPLTTPFARLAGINNVPKMAAAPSVLDVLRNLGGFEKSALSYNDHSLIEKSPYGEYPITGEMMYDYVVFGGRLNKGGLDSYWNSTTYKMDQGRGKLRYSNPGYSMLGELLRVRSGLSYDDYVRTNLLEPLNLQQEIYPDPGHRNAHRVPTQAGLRSYLINTKHPYRSSTPRLASEPVPQPANGDGSPQWSVNAGPIDSSAPATAQRYAGKTYMGGAPLAAGGWVADGKSLGVLIRAIAQSWFLMPESVAAQLWDPRWRNGKTGNAEGWSYGLGWWVRGNWVTMAGGTIGSMSLVAHNTAYDFTVVLLSNVKGNALIDVLNPLLDPTNGMWGTSELGSQFPCNDDLFTFENECSGPLVAY
jgi:CubicO group peptidase (beta-lactamase class C family)